MVSFALTAAVLVLLTSVSFASKCTFGQSCWPSPAIWAAFNASVSGRLTEVFPPAAPCHNDRGLFNAAACAAAQANWTNNFWRSDQPGAYENIFWENGLQECFIDAPRTAPCQQGLVPVMATVADHASDVQASVNFASKHDLHLVVKNTGHDYLGRSSGAGSFAIWTHRLRGIEFVESFRPAGCAASSASAAVTVQAGEQWQDVYVAADARNIVVVGGGAHSVGAAGGWILGGGHGPLSPKYGLGVDNALQFIVITPDGELRTISSCSDPDLFWALRGGGGSTFGVVISVTYRTHPPLHNVVMAALAWGFSTNSSEAEHSAQSTAALKLIPTLADAGWNGYVFLASNSGASLTTTGAIFIQVDSSFAADVSEGNMTRVNATFAPIFEQPGTVAATYTVFPSFFSWFNATISDAGAIGIDTLIIGRLLDRHALTENASGIVALSLNDTFGLSTTVFDFGAPNEPQMGRFAPDSAAVHPSWRTALTSSSMVTTFADNTTAATKEVIRAALTQKTLKLAELAGRDAGAYFNEADAREPFWRQVFWGPHYPRLIDIKKRIDPAGLFTCNRCVGSSQAESVDP